MKMEKRNKFGFPDVGWMREYAQLPYDEKKLLEQLDVLKSQLPYIQDETLREHYTAVLQLIEEGNEANKAVVQASTCLVDTVELMMKTLRRK